jgi:hypothetical protein
VSDMPPPGSHGYHRWFWQGINDLEKLANVTRPHVCVRLNCQIRPGRR